MSKTLKTVLIITAIVAGLVGMFFIGKAVGQDQSKEKIIALQIDVRTPGDFLVDVTPKNTAGEAYVSIMKGEDAVFTFTVTAVDGWDSPIQFILGGLPETEYAFSVNPVPPGGSTVLTIKSRTFSGNTGLGLNVIARGY